MELSAKDMDFLEKLKKLDKMGTELEYLEESIYSLVLIEDVKGFKALFPEFVKLRNSWQKLAQCGYAGYKVDRIMYYNKIIQERGL